MKSLSLLVLLGLRLAWTQTAPPPAAPAPADKGDTVIAIFEDGTQMTLDELKALLPALPQPYAGLAQQDRDRFLHIYAMMRSLVHMAEKQGLEQRSPYKEALAYSRMAALSDIMVKEITSGITVPPEEIEKYYSEHKGPYQQVKVSAMYIAFADAAETPESSSRSSQASRIPPKALTEDEAKAKAARLVSQARAGADFKELVKQNSDDETSRDKGGDFGTWRVSDNVPDLMRPVVFGLRQGEVSEPVRQPHGYYIFRAEEVTYTPFAQVRDALFEQLKQQKAREWMQKLDADTKVQLPKPEPPAPVVKK